MKISTLGILFFMFFLSCKKEAGDGGTSTVVGKIHITEYDSDFQNVKADYPGADVDVYIIYGNGTTYDDNTKTGPNGDFTFKYLRKGDYKIYAYSSADTPSGKETVLKEIKITGRKQTVDAGTIEVKKN